MKRYIPIGLLVLSYLSLSGCAPHRSPYLNTDLTQEAWMQKIDSNPNLWTAGADNWFFTGDANATELRDRNAPYSAAITTMAVRVPFFTDVRTDGDFQVQLYGTYGPNSVTILGPNEGVRGINVEVRGSELCITQSKKVSARTRQVIIRIGVNQLNRLTHYGCGPVEGIQLHSNCLKIISGGTGNMYLAGKINLQRVTNLGSGSINVFGASTPWLEIKTLGPGSVNVAGNVGVNRITHHGAANINIIGATSSGLYINADGKGKIGLNGRDINIREIKARNYVCVFAKAVNSDTLYAYANNKATIGLAGLARNLYVNTAQGGRFDGRYLCAENAFVRARDWSHINVASSNKIFASATQSSSVYFFGQPSLMSQFVSGNGTVIPIWTEGSSNCAAPVSLLPYDYKGEAVTTFPYIRVREHYRPFQHINKIGEG